MKKSILLALLMSTGLFASAQWVTIPDANFANRLNQLYPECMDGDQMDTTCPSIVNETVLYIGSWGTTPESMKVSDLSGIQYFVNLEELDCRYNLLSTLPELPGTLTFLNCSYNNFVELAELPISLTVLNCSHNNISSLQELPPSLTNLACNNNEITSISALPATLNTLSCNSNALTILPELPSSLMYLACTGNYLSELPELPNSLTELWCRHNSITSLPELPNALEILHCNDNKLTELPGLPNSLSVLMCHNIIYTDTLNYFTELPDLPNSLNRLSCYKTGLIQLPELPSSLTELKCFSNNLSSLPDLPQSLTELTCYNNFLTSLPEIPTALEDLHCSDNFLTTLPELPPSLEKLRCANNELTCLPTLPMSLTNNQLSFGFNVSGNPFTCLPNYVPAMSGANNSQWLSYPLCDLGDVDGNPYGCSSLSGIAGLVFDDEDANCEADETEYELVNIPLKLLDENDNLLVTTYTFSNSKYNFVADAGEYKVMLVAENQPYQPSCADPGDEQNVLLTESEPSALYVDFGIECLPGFDVGVQSVTSVGWVFPGQIHTLKIAAGDLSSWYGMQCAEGVAGTLNVNLSGPFSYVGPAPGALTPAIMGDLQFVYDIADFAAIDMQHAFRLLLETDTTAQEGDLVCVDIVVNPIDGDANPENNTHSQCYEVTNSYDPNIKQVWPHDVAPGYDDYFNYTIYFQNTGTAPAFNIRLADTLDTNLDLNTFEVTGYSHPVLTYLHGNVLTFRFNNIMLPDSTTDLEGSIGYVQYRIKAVEGLPVGTIIENTAHIFFDFNEAIVTNTTQNEFVIITSANQPQQQLATVFPNPANGQFNVMFTNSYSGTTHMEVYNLSGQRVMQRQVNENQVVVDLTGYPSGMYLLHLRNEHGSEAVKLLKH